MWPDNHENPDFRSTCELMTSEKGVKRDRQKATGYKQLSALAVATLAMASSMAQATPTVSGNEIQWPNDGWYQVQSSDGATTLCGGGSSCTVPPGSYLVINHTLGIRYADVQVSGVAGSDGIVVSQSTISWPDDGWYQVQSMDGATTYCNGGLSCTVDAGVYRVINHTTGERFDNISVGTEPVASEITVDGQRISWPDDGWYQVQTDNGDESICNGGTYCDVAPGSYLVINHTTGARFTNIVVSDDSPLVDTPTSATINRDNHVDILNEVFSVYTGNVYGDTLPRVPEAFVNERPATELEVTEEMQNGHEEASLFLYACDNGGTMEHLNTWGELENHNSDFTWDNCLEGSLLHYGTLHTEYGNASGGYQRDLVSADYKAVYSTGKTVEISGEFGEIREANVDPDIIRIEYWANRGVDYSLQDATPVMEFSGANTNTQYTWLEQDVNVFTAELSGNFQLNTSLTDGQSIDVTTTETLSTSYTQDGPFEEYRGFVAHPDWTFTQGALEMTADDGSGLSLQADSGDEQTAEISILQDGVVIETFQQPWSLWRDVLTDVQNDVRYF